MKRFLWVLFSLLLTLACLGVFLALMWVSGGRN